MNRLVCFAVAVVAASCAERKAEPPRAPEVLSERMGLSPAPSEKLGLGEECTAFEGSTGCSSGLCVRVLPGFPPRGVCSQRCGPVEPWPSLPDGGSTESDVRPDIGCPAVKGEQWQCIQIMPSRAGFACLPPRLGLDAGLTRVMAASTDGGDQ